MITFSRYSSNVISISFNFNICCAGCKAVGTKVIATGSNVGSIFGVTRADTTNIVAITFVPTALQPAQPYSCTPKSPPTLFEFAPFPSTKLSYI